MVSLSTLFFSHTQIHTHEHTHMYVWIAYGACFLQYNLIYC